MAKAKPIKLQRFAIYLNRPKNSGYLQKNAWGDPEKDWGSLENAKMWKTRAGIDRHIKKKGFDRWGVHFPIKSSTTYPGTTGIWEIKEIQITIRTTP